MCVFVCVYFKNPIPKLGTEPPRISCHPLPTPQPQRSLELSPSPPQVTVPSSAPHPPGCRGRGAGEIPGSCPSCPHFGEVGTSVFISHQCWRSGTMAAPADANIGLPWLLRAGGTDRSLQDLCHSSSPMWGWSLPCNDGEALVVPARVDLPSLRLQVWMFQSFTRG